MPKFQRRLSIASLDEWINQLKIKEKSYPKVAVRIADRLADEMMKCDVYSGTIKVPAILEGNVAKAGIRSTNETDAFPEFGTGIVGSQNPHVAEALELAGWKYDVNEHGEKGWVYPTEDGYRWTKGQPASKKFWNALQKANEMFPEIGKEELLKEVQR